jgi:hypothetical protein
VEEILDYNEETQEYLVSWKGWDFSENTWEPALHLRNAREKVQEFRRAQDELRGPGTPFAGHSEARLTQYGDIVGTMEEDYFCPSDWTDY